MAVEFFIPKMSDHMEDAVFVEWLVTDGEPVEQGEPILVVETDKVVAEVEAPASGWLTGIRPGLEAGVTIAVGVTVAFIVQDSADEVPVLAALDAASSPSLVAETPDPMQTAGLPELSTDELSTDRPPGGPVRATPAGRKAARALGVDLASVQGSGPGGRVSESDVREHAGGTP